jgi:hypothetical protein
MSQRMDISFVESDVRGFNTLCGDITNADTQEFSTIYWIQLLGKSSVLLDTLFEEWAKLKGFSSQEIEMGTNLEPNQMGNLVSLIQNKFLENESAFEEIA